MGVASSPVGSTSTTARDADNPWLLAQNTLVHKDGALWTLSGNYLLGEDITAIGFPTNRASDGHVNVITKPATFSNTTISLVWRVKLTAGHNVDTVGILGHNFDDLPGTVSISIDFDNVNNFTGVNLGVATATIADAKRLIFDNLDDEGVPNRQYILPEYIRIKITSTSALGGSGAIPQIGMVIMGRRKQLSVKPDRPYEPTPMQSNVVTTVFDDGDETEFVLAERLAVIPVSWQFENLPNVGDLNDPATLLAFWRDTKGGSKKFLWCENPFTDVRFAHFAKMQSPSFTQPFETFRKRLSGFTIKEMPPAVDVEFNP